MKNNFVEQVAKTLIEANNKDTAESFILGISGKWGEGKTFFLKNLREALLDNFYVVNINPWKFAQDKPAFLRHFLTQISTEVSSTEDLEDLKYEITKNNISKPWLFALICSFLFILIAIVPISYPQSFGFTDNTIIFFKSTYSHFINSIFYKKIIIFRLPLLYIITAFLIPLYLRMMSFQKKKSSVSTLDEFTYKLKQILNNCDKKIVVYIDDLDRVTPRIAREVLDTMRTFFDNPNLLFVVTGDHSVLERYIGVEVLPEKNESEQIEEGRRYLKKIFNIYWRMLPCSETDFGKFIDEYISESYKTELNTYLNNDSSKFSEYLKKYFKKNYRQVIRFIDFTVFSFRAAKAFQESSEGKTKEFISEIFKYPYLLVKILLLQDLCNPLYEILLSNPATLNKLERFISRKEVDQFNSEITNLTGNRLSPGQMIICKKIFEECDNFYTDSNLIVKSSKPFLYLSADNEWDDEGGSQPADFFAYLTSGDSKSAEASILMSGEETLRNCGEFTLENLKNLEKTDNFDVPMESLVKTLSLIPPDNKFQQIIAEGIKTLDILFTYDALPATDEKRALQYINIWNWLDDIARSDWFELLKNDYITKFTPMKYAEDFPRIEQTDQFGFFSSTIVSRWLIQYFKQGASDRIDMIIKFQEKLDPSVFLESFNTIADDLVNLFQSETNENREKILTVILKLGDQQRTSLIDSVKKMINSFIPDLAIFFSTKLDDPSVGVSKDDFALFLAQGFEGINGPIGPTEFNSAFDLCNKLKLEFNDKVWDSILSTHEEYFINWLPQIQDIDYSDMAPEKKCAQKVYSLIVGRIKNSEIDANTKNDYFAYLYPEKWLWKKYHHIDMRSISGMEKYIEQSKIDDLKTQWNNTNE